MEQHLFLLHDDGKKAKDSCEFALRINLSEEQRHNIGRAFNHSRSGHEKLELFTVGESVGEARLNMGYAIRHLAEVFRDASAELNSNKHYITERTLQNGILPEHLEEVDDANKTKVTLKLTDEQIKQIKKLGIEVNL